MTEEEMQKIVDMIVEQLFIRINDEAKAMNEEFINSLPSNDEQIIELSLLLKHYESIEDYTNAANVFTKIKNLQSGHDK
jgi:protein-arginine kinase activator protein McsA